MENAELNAVALRLSKAFCATQKFECGEIECLCSLLDEFSLASKGCEYNYFDCEVQNGLYLTLEFELDKIWFNFYDVNASQGVFCYGVECSNDWNGANEIINELQKLI